MVGAPGCSPRTPSSKGCWLQLRPRHARSALYLDRTLCRSALSRVRLVRSTYKPHSGVLLAVPCVVGSRIQCFVQRHAPHRNACPFGLARSLAFNGVHAGGLWPHASVSHGEVVKNIIAVSGVVRSVALHQAIWHFEVFSVSLSAEHFDCFHACSLQLRCASITRRAIFSEYYIGLLVIRRQLDIHFLKVRPCQFTFKFDSLG